MQLQYLVSAVNQEVDTLAQRMNLSADSIVIHQCGRNEYKEYDYRGNRIRVYSFAERGVGLSRNNALMRADREICLFADEDIVYREDAAQAVLRQFELHPEADMLLFNMEVPKDRRTYHIDSYGRVHWFNCGRYPTYSFAARTQKLHRLNVSFSLLFGGGARYSNGEDSLFLMECIRRGMKVYHTPEVLGRENGRPSTWFHGYTQKFFYDRGVLYHFLYRRAARLMALRFLAAHGKEMCTAIPFSDAFRLMRRGIRMEELSFDDKGTICGGKE